MVNKIGYSTEKRSIVPPRNWDDIRNDRNFKLKTVTTTNCSLKKRVFSIGLSVVTLGVAPAISKNIRSGVMGQKRNITSQKLNFQRQEDVKTFHEVATQSTNIYVIELSYRNVSNQVAKYYELKELGIDVSSDETNIDDKIEYLNSMCKKHPELHLNNYNSFVSIATKMAAKNYTHPVLPEYERGSVDEVNYIKQCKKLNNLQRYILKVQSGPNPDPEHAKKLVEIASQKAYQSWYFVQDTQWLQRHFPQV